MNKIRTIIAIIALAVLAYAGYQLYDIFSGYIKAEKEYAGLAEEYTRPSAKSVETEETESEETESATEQTKKKKKKDKEGTAKTTYEYGYIEDADVPLEIDWEALKAQNSDVVGWIYVEAFPSVSYPIMQTDNNDFYLHRDFNKEYLYAGSIFLDYRDSWKEPASVVYGHNMKNGSMFAQLKKLKDQATYDSAPYFWILTPDGNYRYHIYAVFDTTPDSAVYSSWNHDGENFLAWEKDIQGASAIKNNVMLTEHDHSVILSTCHPNHTNRTVVIGRCCSSQQPPRKEAE